MKYTNFAETFQYSSFALSIGFMYPNPCNERTRFFAIGMILLSFAPASLIFASDAIKSYIIRDLDNLTRQVTLIIPFFGISLKMVLANVFRKDFEYILNEVDSDLKCTNYLSDDYKQIVDRFIKSGMTGQRVWILASFFVTGVFTVMASSLMMYHNLTHNEVKRYMVHEVSIPYLGDKRYDSPYFEIFFAYMLYLSYFFIINFIAYDGTFCIVVNHGSLKYKLMTHRLKEIFNDFAKDLETARNELRSVIYEHQNIIEYVNRLQNFYGIWLALVFLLTLLQICMTLYQLTQAEHFDPKYMIFVIGSVNHVYVPCHYAAVLQYTARDCSTEMFASGWERCADSRVTNAIRFMVSRAQVPVLITAMGMVTFDMILFVSMLQTSYSMFTLLTT